MRESGLSGRVGAVAQTRKSASNSLVSNKAEFDVESFLEPVRLSRKQLVFQRNEVIFSHRDPAGNVFYIQKGTVKLSVNSDIGKRAVLAVVHPSRKP
jgi:CRP-like cAMP-binding protein